MTNIRRGQVLVLACVTMLMVALTLMLSFNLVNAIHERIRLQATADAQALTIATLEARALNTTAYLNRSIAGALVAQMEIHAWRAMVDREKKIFDAALGMFSGFAAAEKTECLDTWPIPNDHCTHQATADANVANLASKVGTYNTSSIDGVFNPAVDAVAQLVKNLHDEQIDVLTRTKAEMSPTSTTLTRVKDSAAPRATFAASMHATNVKEFFCALEIHNTGAGDTDCPSGPTMLSNPERAGVMESAALAARPDFVAGGSGVRTLGHSDFSDSSSAVAGLVTTSNPSCCTPSGATVTVTQTTPASTYLRSGANVGADLGIDMVSVSVDFGGHSHSAILPVNGRANSSSDKAMPCESTGACFVSFRADSSDADLGQPSVFAGVSQELWQTRAGGSRPWEVNSTGTVDIKLTSAAPARLVLRPQGTGYAVAKAKTYFHQLGYEGPAGSPTFVGWQVPPNMFDPFWRAKLHPFEKDELKSRLGDVGDTVGVSIVNVDGPVEGRDL